MKELIIFAFILSATLIAMGTYVKAHPPDASATGVLWLRRGLQVGIASSTVVLLIYIVMFFFPPVSPSLVWPLILFACAGNILNLVSLVYCLRELNGESLFAALFVLLNQLLWALFALRAMTVDF
jgi:hypothetical protein